jgi:hypothetical protein
MKSMTLSEYRINLLDEIRASAQMNNTFAEMEFVTQMFNRLSDAEEIIDPVILYYDGIGKRNRRIGLDGYQFDEGDSSLAILISDYSKEDDPPALNSTMIENYMGRIRGFVEDVITTDLLNNIDFSVPAYGFGCDVKRMFNQNEIVKFKFYVISDRVMSSRIKLIKAVPLLGVDVEYHVWDVERLYHLDNAHKGKESIVVDFKEISGQGLSCVRAASASSSQYDAYLAVIPGQILADMYLKYGSRLLEGNVRSFLNVRGKVNKGIRTTIMNEPFNFFTYNNGIAVTCTQAETDNADDPKVIYSIKDMQIINGGQTTASLAMALIKDKRDLSSVYVPMKLTVVDDQIADEMIPNISKYANSQNRVSEADFFSNHPFHIRMEQMSRHALAPSVDGNQYQTRWYYERARGQFQQEQMKLSVSEKAKFLLRNPKSQMITKTDLAKYYNTYQRKPHVVSLGAQKNMRKFAEYIEKKWTESNTQFNEQYYRRIVSLAILYKHTEKMVAKAEWYSQGYRANIVTYAIAKMFDEIHEKYDNHVFNFRKTWQTQRVDDVVSRELEVLGRMAMEHITSEKRPVQNVTEWCKRQDCWLSFKNIRHDFSPEFASGLMEKTAIAREESRAKKEQRGSNDVAVEIEVVRLGAAYWNDLYSKSVHLDFLTPKEKQILKYAADMEVTGRTPNTSQSKILLEVREKLREEGIT